MKNKIILLGVCLYATVARAQVRVTLSYADYLHRVQTKNLSYAAEKLNISVAEAEVTAARIFDDPTLSFEYGDNDDHRLQMGRSYSAEISQTISIGKRSARIGMAKSEKEVAVALLDDYFRQLRAEATLSYLKAIQLKEVLELKRLAFQNISELAKADSIRFSLGGITEVDAMQSRAEAKIQRNELRQAEVDLYQACTDLNIPLGSFSRDTLYVPKGSLQLSPCSWGQPELLAAAVDNRADLVAALKNVEVARKALTLTKRERGLDFDVAIGFSHNNEVRNEIAPAPKFNALTVGVSVPLKFSNLNKGAVRSAQFQIEQAQLQYKQAQVEVQSEVMKNYHAYIAVGVQADAYQKEHIEKLHEDIIKGKTYSYNRGETSLLEVLEAQRTYNEVRGLYIETLFNYAAALVELEKSAGVWDITIH